MVFPLPSVKILIFVPFLPRSAGLAPVPPNGNFVIEQSIYCHSHSGPFRYHLQQDQLSTCSQISLIFAIPEIDYERYLELHKILAMIFIGSHYEEDKKYRSLLSYQLF
jgi:hypothetical protein